MNERLLTGPPLHDYRNKTLNQLFLNAAADYAPRPAFGRATDANRVTYAETLEIVQRVAGLLTSYGIQAGDRVAILSENRPEWAFVDYAILSLGAVTVPVYPTLPAGQVHAIIEDCGTQLAFVSTREQFSKVEGTVHKIVVFDDDAAGPGATSFNEALERAVVLPDWRERAVGVEADALATLIYTSGTTGIPKGVMLTHRNLASMVAATWQHGALPVRPGDVSLSILPLSHVFERAVAYYFFSQGATIVYAESMQTVPRDLAAVKPNHVVAVPRLFEKVYAAVTSSHGIKGKIARWAASVAVDYTKHVTHGRRPPAALRMQHSLADRAVYKVLRARMGGRLQTFICGGAPLDSRVGSLFHAAGLPIYEGYGLTETSPVISANRPGAVHIGSGGVPFPGVEVRLGDEDEIQSKGPGVTQGYWRRAGATSAAFTADGWFRTGDVGKFDHGFVYIVDRLKDLIVTAGGKNIAPQPLEQRISSSPVISQAVVLGDRRPYAVVLIVPNFQEVVDAMHIAMEPPPALAAKPEVLEFLANEASRMLGDAARVERPRRLAVVTEEFTVENGLMTPTLKIRRRAIEERYRTLVEAVYAIAAGVPVP